MRVFFFRTLFALFHSFSLFLADSVEISPGYRNFYDNSDAYTSVGDDVNKNAEGNIETRSNTTHVSESAISSGSSRTRTDTFNMFGIGPGGGTRGSKRKLDETLTSQTCRPLTNSSIASTIKPPQSKKRFTSKF